MTDAPTPAETSRSADDIAVRLESFVASRIHAAARGRPPGHGLE